MHYVTLDQQHVAHIIFSGRASKCSALSANDENLKQNLKIEQTNFTMQHWYLALLNGNQWYGKDAFAYIFVG